MTDAEKADPRFTVRPRYWVPETEVRARLRNVGWDRKWLLGWRDICRATDERTVIAAVVPISAVGHTMPLFVFKEVEPPRNAAFIANMTSLVFDFVARQKVGGTHLTYTYLKQLPVLAAVNYTPADLDFIVPRVLELTYTAEDLRPWAEDLGYDGDPFPWNPERRAVLRAELDAYYARFYGLTRDELCYILDPADVMGPDYPSETFRVLKNNEEREFGEYRTRRLVLEAWDRLTKAAPYEPPVRLPAAQTPPVRSAPAPMAARPRDVIPFPRVRPSYEERYKRCLPVLNLKAAAGGFGEQHLVEFEDWVEVPVDLPLRKGMFIAQVIGRSMEPTIPDRAWCIFDSLRGARPRDGDVVLAELHDATDPEHGGRHTVKRFRHRDSIRPDGERVSTVRLEPDNAEFPPIVVVHAGGEEPSLRVIARLVQVLEPVPHEG